MKSLIQYSLLAVFCLVALTNCRAKAPDLTGAVRPAPAPAIPKKLNPKDWEHNFYFNKRSEKTVKQDKYDANHMTVNYRVLSNDGKSVDKLKKEDFRVLENNIPVEKFLVSADENTSFQVVDIVFVVDITGSMGPFIEHAKVVLDNFIRNTRPKYHIRMCLSTFGDYVTQKCDTFYDNSSPAQVRQFRNALFNLSIKKGQGEVKGELDTEENSMRALLEATKSQWAAEQRFVILVSDADFYSPEKPSKHFAAHQARPDSTAAPSMAEVNAAIKSSQVKVFTITPPATGYNSPLGDQPDITTSSQGQWFEFRRVLSREIPLDSIFKAILKLINTNYTLTYVVDQNKGLNPTLPKDQRKVEVSTPKGNVQIESVNSSMPTGRPEYKQKWTLGDKAIRTDSIRAFLDGKPLDKSEYTVKGSEVTLTEVPKPNAELKFNYFYENLSDNMNMTPLNFEGKLTSANTKVWLNGEPARAGDVLFSKDIDGGTSLSFGANVLSTQDPYGIRTKESLNVKVQHDPNK